MKNKIICLLCLLPLVFCLLVVPSFAAESSPTYYTAALHNGNDFDYTGTVYLLPRTESTRQTYTGYKMVARSGVISIYVNYYFPAVGGLPEQDYDVIMEYDRSLFYLVVDFSSPVISNNFDVASDIDRFNSIYRLSITSLDRFVPVPAIGGSRHWYLDEPCDLYSYTDNGLFVFLGRAPGIIFDDVFLFKFTVTGTYETVVLGQGDEPYLTYSGGLYTGGNRHEVYEFYSRLLPVNFPVIEDDPIEEVPNILIDFISGIFEGLSHLYIFPGVSVMGLIFGVFGILIFRYIIKLFAGG